MAPTLAALLLAALGVQPPPPQQQQQQQQQQGCEVDRAAMMELNIHAFDQDMDGGWRPLARRPECRDEAAELIRAYREFIVNRTRILYWHEGQLRAGLGETEAAIALFEQSRRTGADEYGWNHYVDASIAFLRRDRSALEAARARLAQAKVVDAGSIPGLSARPGPPKPMNLDVVDAFVRCFDRPYQEAYSADACRKAAAR